MIVFSDERYFPSTREAESWFPLLNEEDYDLNSCVRDQGYREVDSGLHVQEVAFEATDVNRDQKNVQACEDDKTNAWCSLATHFTVFANLNEPNRSNENESTNLIQINLLNK